VALQFPAGDASVPRGATFTFAFRAVSAAGFPVVYVLEGAGAPGAQVDATTGGAQGGVDKTA